MKFWQKLFLSMLLLFILVFDAGVYVIASYSYRVNLEREEDSAVREQELIQVNIDNSVAAAASVFPGASAQTPRMAAIIEPLQEYYEKQGVYLALYRDGAVLSSNIPDVDARILKAPAAGAKNILQQKSDHSRMLFIASPLPRETALTFVYARDVSALDLYRADISRVFIFLNIAVCLILGLTIFLILRRMTRPIGILNRATREIAEGAYDKRVAVKNRDELGELADTFNRMAASVEHQVEHLQQAAEDKQTFIDNLSHEMKTPLTSILGYADFLQKAHCDEDARRTATENLYQSAAQLHKLSSKLLDIVYLSQETITRCPVEITQLFEDLRQFMELPLAERGVLLEIEAEEEGLVGDETLLLSLLSNLVENAARASLRGQTIRLRSYRMGGAGEDGIAEAPSPGDSDTGGFIVLEVSDDGKGMNAEEAARITAPFYRVDKARSRKDGGVGLGLSICKRIADLHGAQLRITSVPGAGTTVKILFPDA